ncbi:bifunctional DNA primase/polymerase [Acetobacteraceae bacterium KSS8]|uniref:Bifunctional DNA primase/polymerase n=1 Tax=Endosaccharibacter trunci TaxID=2812733 RepID=A0ABT1WAF8_9PROT|nr:bifunctional DNA primase/polymerase [Acetobacteraceae bacterium KSS8]
MIPDQIERVALLGWAVYPMSATSKAGCFKGAADAATCDLDQIERWSDAYPDCNWRVVCGPSGLFALDVDRPGTHHHDGFAAMADLVSKHGPLPPRPMTRTGGSGGAALFFKHQGEKLRGMSGQPAPGLDPHRGRQAIVIPPSRHPVTGGHYRWREGCAPWEVNLPSIPGWLSAALAPAPERPFSGPWVPTSERARTAIMRAIHAIADAPSGQANVTLNKQAFRLGGWCGAGMLSQDEAESALDQAARQRNIPSREARDTIRSGITAGLKRPIQARHVGG